MTYDVSVGQALLRAGVPTELAAALAGARTATNAEKIAGLIYGGMDNQQASRIVTGVANTAEMIAAFEYMGLTGTDAVLLAGAGLGGPLAASIAQSKVFPFSTNSVTMDSPASSFSKFYVVYFRRGSAVNLASVSDNKGGTWTALQQIVSANDGVVGQMMLDVWKGENIPAGQTPTISVPSAGGADVGFVVEVVGTTVKGSSSAAFPAAGSTGTAIAGAVAGDVGMTFQAYGDSNPGGAQTQSPESLGSALLSFNAAGNTYGLLYAKVLTTSGSLSGTGISFGGRCWAAGAVLVGK